MRQTFKRCPYCGSPINKVSSRIIVYGPLNIKRVNKYMCKRSHVTYYDGYIGQKLRMKVMEKEWRKIERETHTT